MFLIACIEPYCLSYLRVSLQIICDKYPGLERFCKLLITAVAEHKIAIRCVMLYLIFLCSFGGVISAILWVVSMQAYSQVM